MRPLLLVIAIALAAGAACKSASNPTGPCLNALTLHAVFDAAASDEKLRVWVPYLDVVQPQDFPIPVGATEITVTVEAGNDVAGRTIGVQLLHGPVIVGVSNVEVHDFCSIITVDSWLVDQGLAPHD